MELSGRGYCPLDSRGRDRTHRRLRQTHCSSCSSNTFVPCQYAQITVTACLFRASCFSRLSSVRAWREGGGWWARDGWRRMCEERKKGGVERWQWCDHREKKEMQLAIKYDYYHYLHHQSKVWRHLLMLFLYHYHFGISL